MDYTKLLTEKPQFLSLIPAVTFGYLFHLKGGVFFLASSLFLILPAGLAIQGGERGYALELTESNLKNVLIAIILLVFYLSFFVGPYMLFKHSDHSDFATSGLIVGNLGFIIFVYSDTILEHLGSKPETDESDLKENGGNG